MAKVKVGVKMRLSEWDPDAALDQLYAQFAKGLDTVVGPHLLEVAKSRAPVSQERNTITQSQSFLPVRVAEADEGKFTTEQRLRRRDLAGLSQRELAREIKPRDIALLRGTKGSRNTAATPFTGKKAKFDNRARQPDTYEIFRGFVRGEFRHQPGTLRDSHVYIPAKRVGNKVVGTVRATAEYAAAIHEGFDHKGGANKQGKTTRIKGRKWLKEALVNVRDDLKSSSTYEG